MSDSDIFSPDAPEEGGGNRCKYVSFSMANVLNLIRSRQQNLQRVQQSREANIGEERKEVAREKRRRRRQRQKMKKELSRARAKFKEDQQSICSNEETHDSYDRDVDSTQNDVPTQSDAIETAGNSPKPRKRIKLSHNEPESSSIASTSGQNESILSAKASRDAIRLRSLVPRVVMLKKTS